MPRSDTEALGVLERETLNQIYYSVGFGIIWLFEWTGNCMNLHNDVDAVQRINIQRLQWLSYALRIDEDVAGRRVFDEITKCWKKERSFLHWKNHAEKILSSFGVFN